MTNFIAFSQNDEKINYGADSIEGTARAMLNYDCFAFDIVHGDDNYFHLFVSCNSANSMLGAKNMAEWPDYAAASEAAVYENVVKMGGVQGCYAMSEADYAKMLAEVE